MVETLDADAFSAELRTSAARWQADPEVFRVLARTAKDVALTKIRDGDIFCALQ
jgi:hypothetical protein